MDNPPVQLIEVAKAHVAQIMTWFPTEHSCRVWGGPEFRFPFTAETFLADSKLTSLPSYALIRESAELCGFPLGVPKARCLLTSPIHLR